MNGRSGNEQRRRIDCVSRCNADFFWKESPDAIRRKNKNVNNRREFPLISLLFLALVFILAYGFSEAYARLKIRVRTRVGA